MGKVHITRALNKHTNQIVSIRDVERGLQKNIICACCKAPLIANKGEVKAHYFSHYADEPCAGAYETQLHLTAKEYFQQEGVIPIPLLPGWVASEQCQLLKVLNVRVEFTVENRRPDLIAEAGGEIYWIEIANKHKCDADKIRDCRDNNRNVIEIDVSECGDLDEFSSLDLCFVKALSIHPCNAFIDEIARNTVEKHEQVRKQVAALDKSLKQLAEKEGQKKRQEQNDEERHRNRLQRQEAELERIALRKSEHERLLEELEKAISAHQQKKKLLEGKIAAIEEVIHRRALEVEQRLEQENEMILNHLKNDLEAIWQVEVADKRKQFEQELKMEFDLRFSKEQAEWSQRWQDLRDAEHEFGQLFSQKPILEEEIAQLKYQKDRVLYQQKHEVEQEVIKLTRQQQSLYEQIDNAENSLKKAFTDLNMTDTYAANLEEVRAFNEARTDYRNVHNEKLRRLNSLDEEFNFKSTELHEIFKKLTIALEKHNQLCRELRRAKKSLANTDVWNSLPDAMKRKLSVPPLAWPQTADLLIQVSLSE